MDDKKITQRLAIILLILISVAIIIVAFVGIYMQKLNKLKNIVPEATYSSEIDGTIEYRFFVDETEEEKEVYVDDDGNIVGYVEDGDSTSDEDWVNYTGYSIEEQVVNTNKDEDLTEENYRETKSIIQKRLDSMGATEYSIRLNESTGELVVYFSENDDVETLYQTAICTTGEYRIIDYQTGAILIDQSHIKSMSTQEYSSDGVTYSVYLSMELDEEGTEILTELSKEYIEYVDEEGETQTDLIAIQLDGSTLYRTYFGEEYTDSTILIPIGSNITDDETLNAYVEIVDMYADLFNYGELPIAYTTNSTGAFLIRTNVTENVLLGLEIGLIACLAVVTIVFAIRFGKRGFVSGILNAACIAILLLVLRLLPLTISVSSMVTITVLVLINILFYEKYLKALENGEEKPYQRTILSYYGSIFPVIVVAFVFTVSSINATITGIGMTLFWGLIIDLIYNGLISRYVLSKMKK